MLNFHPHFPWCWLTQFHFFHLTRVFFKELGELSDVLSEPFSRWFSSFRYQIPTFLHREITKSTLRYTRQLFALCFKNPHELSMTAEHPNQVTCIFIVFHVHLFICSFLKFHTHSTWLEGKPSVPARFSNFNCPPCTGMRIKLGNNKWRVEWTDLGVNCIGSVRFVCWARRTK